MTRATHRAVRLIAMFWLATVLLPTAALAESKCVGRRLPDLPVTINGMRPTIDTQINGKEARFILDSGAFWSMMPEASAKQYGLRIDHSQLKWLTMHGVGGDTSVGLATVKDLTVFGFSLKNHEFLVGGSAPDGGNAGVIGQDLLHYFDVEYDFAHGAIRLFKNENCRKADLAYWVPNGGAYSVINIDMPTAAYPHTVGTAYLNGEKIRVIFDTGAFGSIVNLRTAEHAGKKRDAPDVQSAGVSLGIGRRAMPTWIATFASFKIGEEEIHNARLRFGDLGYDTDMLLGIDFFLSHRIYVANEQGRLYFTYNGGPVFNLKDRPPMAGPAAIDAAPTAASAPTSDASAATPTGAVGNAAAGASAAPTSATNSTAPLDADGYARRGTAFESRHDFEQALADFNRAIEMNANDPAFYFLRARVQLASGRRELAQQDLERSLSLKPDYIEPLLMLTEMKTEAHEASALEHAETLDRLLPKQSVERLRLANLYSRLDKPGLAIVQLNDWIEVHQDDVRLPGALSGRCWNRMLLAQELEQALKDCDGALRRNPKMPAAMDARGYVYLRLGKFDKAIADFTDLLKANPKAATSLYGRGLAQLHKGLTAEGQKDLDGATALDAARVEHLRHFGLAP